MTTHIKPLEELVKELPPSRRDEVRNFIESLLSEEENEQPPSTQEGRREFRELFGIWDSGDGHSADNERIDADLAREYASTHETDT